MNGVVVAEAGRELLRVRPTVLAAGVDCPALKRLDKAESFIGALKRSSPA